MKEKEYIITLDDNKEYALVDRMMLDNKEYVYLIEIDNYDNVIFAERIGDTLKFIEDGELLARVIDKFNDMEVKDGENS